MQFNFKKMLPDVAAIVLFLLLSFTYFMTPLGQGMVLGGHDAVASVGQGREQADYFNQTGQRTRWTGTLFCGMPTYQIAPSYKSSVFLGKVARIYELGMTGAMSYVFLYLLGFYIMLRAFGCKSWLSALGAIAWAFSSYFLIIIAAGHIWKVLTLAFIPPTIGGLLLCYKKKYLWGGGVTALFTAFQILSNHIQMSYYFAFVMGFIVLAYLAQAIRKKKIGDWTKSTGVVIIAGLLGVACNLPNLYHTYSYAKLSMRGPSELTQEQKKGSNEQTGGLDRDYITQWSYGIDETLTLLVPNFKGGASAGIIDQPEASMLPGYDQFYQYAGAAQQAFAKSGMQVTPPGLNAYWGDQPFTAGPVYAGAIICFFFIFGLFFVKGPLKWALLASSVLSLLFAWGHNSPILTNFFINHLPLYNKFRTVSSALVVLEFAMPLLAVLSLAEIFKRKKEVLSTRRGKVGFIVAAALTLGVSLLLALFPGLAGNCISGEDQVLFAKIGTLLGMPFSMAYQAAVTQMHHAILSHSAWRSAGFLIVGIGVTFAYIRFSMKEWVVCLILGALCLADLWSVDKRYLNDGSFTDPVAMQKVTPTPADLRILQDKSNYRVLNLSEGNPFNETSNHTAYFHRSIGGYNPAKLHRFQDLIDKYLNTEVMNLYQVAAKENGDLSKVNGDSIFPMLNMLNAKYIIFGPQAEAVFENPYADGNAWFVRNIEFAKTPDSEINRLKDIHPRLSAVISEKYKTAFSASPLDSGSVKLESYLPNELRYHVSSPKGGVIVFSEIYYPGWTAEIDGKPVEIFPADYVLRALKAPAGEHQIIMKFYPTSIVATETIAFIAIFLTLLGFLVALVFRLRVGKDKTKA